MSSLISIFCLSWKIEDACSMFERSYSSSCFNYLLFHRVSLTSSTTIYKKDYELIMFQMETKGKKNLTKKQFTQIFKLESNGPFETLAPNQVFAMLNEIGYYPSITLIGGFRKSNLPSMWCFFFCMFI